jgi:hypothetical protein
MYQGWFLTFDNRRNQVKVYVELAVPSLQIFCKSKYYRNKCLLFSNKHITPKFDSLILLFTSSVTKNLMSLILSFPIRKMWIRQFYFKSLMGLNDAMKMKYLIWGVLGDKTLIHIRRSWWVWARHSGKLATSWQNPTMCWAQDLYWLTVDGAMGPRQIHKA